MSADALCLQADSGFGSRETSGSPLPSARLLGASNSKLSLSPLQAYQELSVQDLTYVAREGRLGEDRSELPDALAGLSISSSAQLQAEQQQHVNEEERHAMLDDCTMEHFGDQRSSADEGEGEAEEKSEDRQEDGAQIATRAASSVQRLFPPSQSRLQPTQARYGIRTSAPTRKPMNLRI